MRPVLLLSLTLALLVVAFTPAHAPAAQSKPAAPPKVADLLNLGPLGGKAKPAHAATLADGEKFGLSVVSVAPKSPGAEAGLLVDDVLVGAAGKLFEKDAYLELAAAIEAAEAGISDEAAILKLKLRRKGVISELEVELTPYGAANNAGGKPGDAMRDALIKAACAWLARNQQSDGSFPCSFSVENGLVVQTSLAGLCFLAAGHTPETGDHAKRVLKAAEYVLENVGEQKQFKKLDGKNNDQTHWNLGYGAIFLAHVYHLTDKKWLAKSTLKRIKPKLEWIRGKIMAGMQPSGGFGHGPGGPNVLGYVELEVMSNLLLSALGCIKGCGIELDAKKVDPMLAFVAACTDDQGSVGYSTTPPQSFLHTPTRSAGAANALAALGQKTHAIYPRLVECSKANFAQAFEGHSTPTMHQLSMALVAAREGVLVDYWKAMRHEFTMVRNSDGSFAYRPTADTAMLGMNLDRDMNECWTTSHWTLVLCLERTGLPLWKGQ